MYKHFLQLLWVIYGIIVDHHVTIRLDITHLQYNYTQHLQIT